MLVGSRSLVWFSLAVKLSFLIGLWMSFFMQVIMVWLLAELGRLACRGGRIALGGWWFWIMHGVVEEGDA